MGQDPDAIRQDIEQTRAEMSETVGAVGYKADVPSRAKEAVSDKVENVKAVSGTAARAKEAVTATDRAGEATPAGVRSSSTRRAAGLARENPLGLAIGAAAIGFLAGWCALDPGRGRAPGPGRRPGHGQGQGDRPGGPGPRQAGRPGRASTAADTAKQRTQEQGQELADTAQQHAGRQDPVTEPDNGQAAGRDAERPGEIPPRDGSPSSSGSRPR